MRVHRLCRILKDNDGRLLSWLAEHIGYARILQSCTASDPTSTEAQLVQKCDI